MPQELTPPPSRLRRVLVDEPVRLGAVRGGEKLERVANATWTFFALRGERRERIDAVERPFSGNRASAIWEAKGPDDARERSVRVVYTVKVGAVERDGGEEIEVYVPWIEVTAVDAQGRPVVNAAFKLVYDGVPQEGDPFRTDDQGKRRIEEVPPCAVSIVWQSPHRLMKWEGDASLPRRKAVLAPYRAKFLWPTVGNEGLHKQWVNLADYPIQPDHRESATLRIGVKDGAGAGAPFWVKAEYARDKCLARADGTWYPSQEEPFKRLSSGVYLAKGTLGEDGVGTVKIVLSRGLGDLVKLSVGSTSECSDETLSIQSWRKFRFKEDDARDLPGAVLAGVKAAFADSFIDVERTGRCKLPRRAIAHEVPGDWLGAKWLMDRDAGGRYVYVDTTDKNEVHSYWNSDIGDETRLWKVDGFYKEQQRNVRFKLYGESSTFRVNVTKGFTLFPKRLATGAPFAVATCKLRDQVVTPTLKFEIAPDAESFTVSIEAPAPTVHGEGIGLFAPLSISLDYTEIYPTAGGALGPNCAVIHFDFRDDAFYISVLAHEFAHIMDQARSQPKEAAFGTEAHPFHFTDHGFSGPHCSSGLTKSQRSKTEYNVALHHKGIYGDCLMWGSLPKPPNRPATRFCAQCIKFARMGF